MEPHIAQLSQATQALETAQRVNDIGVVGVLVIVAVFLGYLLKNKKSLEDSLEKIANTYEKMVENAQFQQKYCEKLMEDSKIQQAKILEILKEISTELAYNRALQEQSRQIQAKQDLLKNKQ